MHRILKTKGHVSRPSFFSFCIFSDLHLFKKCRKTPPCGQTGKTPKKKSRRLRCITPAARLTSAFGRQSRYFLPAPILMMLSIAVATPAAATTAPRTIVTMLRPCFIFLPCLSLSLYENLRHRVNRPCGITCIIRSPAAGTRRAVRERDLPLLYSLSKDTFLFNIYSSTCTSCTSAGNDNSPLTLSCAFISAGYKKKISLIVI